MTKIGAPVLPGEKDIPYTLKKSASARRMRIAVHCDGAVIVTVPSALPQNELDRFLAAKMAWIAKTRERLRPFQKRVLPHERKKDFLANKNQAEALIRQRVAHFNAFYDFSPKKITIRNQKTRWGSCSRTGNLSFHYKMLSLPDYMRDYIVVHELCHLKELNHSRAFWHLVARAMPQHQAIRKTLRKIKMR